MTGAVVQLGGVLRIRDASRLAHGGELRAPDLYGLAVGVLDVVAALEPAALVFARHDLELELDVAAVASAGGLDVGVGDDGFVLAFGQGLELPGRRFRRRKLMAAMVVFSCGLVSAIAGRSLGGFGRTARQTVQTGQRGARTRPSALEVVAMRRHLSRLDVAARRRPGGPGGHDFFSHFRLPWTRPCMRP